MPLHKKSEKLTEARESLPEDLRPVFDQMVEEYSFHALVLYGQSWVAYKVIAALVKDGWRPTRSQ